MFRELLGTWEGLPVSGPIPGRSATPRAESIALLVSSAVAPGTFDCSLGPRSVVDQGLVTGLTTSVTYVLTVASQDLLGSLTARGASCSKAPAARPITSVAGSVSPGRRAGCPWRFRPVSSLPPSSSGAVDGSFPTSRRRPGLRSPPQQRSAPEPSAVWPCWRWPSVGWPREWAGRWRGGCPEPTAPGGRRGTRWPCSRSAVGSARCGPRPCAGSRRASPWWTRLCRARTRGGYRRAAAAARRAWSRGAPWVVRADVTWWRPSGPAS
jgi:hypothetical protein